MPPVKKLKDNNELVPTEGFPNAFFPFEKFNPLQSRVVEFYNKDCNAIIAAATSAGKTVVAEMFLSDEVRVRGGKGMYLAPLKALAQEKIDDWTPDPTVEDLKHHFNDLNISICTGDYQLTASRKKELEKADLVLMTSEMLNSRCRNFKSEQNNWLCDVGTLIVDESHLLTVPQRGDKLEVALMKMSQIAPNCRIVLLSATMPNVDEISDWVAYSLTNRETYLVESDYRPCPLTVHYEKYWDSVRTYEEGEREKVNSALQLVEDFPEDKFLIFSHTKNTGKMMQRAVENLGEECEFHNADLDKAKRIKLEKRFKTDPKLRVIVATSTLAWGLNLPARRVIIVGVHRGLQEVESYDVTQMVGRAGRPAFDPCGDAYVLLPNTDYSKWKERIQKPHPIRSQLLTQVNEHYKVLAFHLVAEIHHGYIHNRADIKDWYSRSLAHWQAQDLDNSIIDSTIETLKMCRAIYEEDGEFKVSKVGAIASMFYYSPFDVADLKRNFGKLFDRGQEDNDYYVSLALGNTDTHRGNIVSKAERFAMSSYSYKAQRLVPDIYEPAIKAGYAYHQLMNGVNNNTIAGFMRGLQFDFDRTIQVLQAIDSMAGRWEQKSYLRTLGMRIKYGVKGEMVHLCEIPNIGKVRAEKLWRANLRTYDAIANNPGKVQSLLKLKQEKIEEICRSANDLSSSG